MTLRFIFWLVTYFAIAFGCLSFNSKWMLAVFFIAYVIVLGTILVIGICSDRKHRGFLTGFATVAILYFALDSNSGFSIAPDLFGVYFSGIGSGEGYTVPPVNTPPLTASYTVTVPFSAFHETLVIRCSLGVLAGLVAGVFCQIATRETAG